MPRPYRAELVTERLTTLAVCCGAKLLSQQRNSSDTCREIGVLLVRPRPAIDAVQRRASLPLGKRGNRIMWNRRRVLQGSATLLLPSLPAVAAPKPVVGQPAPDAELVLIDGTKLRLSEMRGDVVVLNIWATWCAPCRRERPLLNSYYALQKAHGLRVYALSTEDSLPLYRLKPLFEKLTIQPTRRIKGPYAAIDGAVPSNYVIDRSGVLRYAEAAAFDLDDLNRELVPLLNEPRPV